MNTRIRRIEYQLPEHEVTNEAFLEKHPEWDMNAVAERAGVEVRYFSESDETALDLAEKACLKLFENDPESLANVGALIFCTQTPDHPLPSNACLLHGRLAMKEEVFAFDVAMGCSGFVNGLALAHGFIQSCQADSVLLVTGDTLSKRVSDDDRSVAVLFGDGAAATLVDKSEEEGLIDVEAATAGKYWDRIMIPAGGSRMPHSEETSIPEEDSRGNIRTKNDVWMDGLSVLGLVNTRVPSQIQKLLERNHVTLDDVDLCVFHQASKVTLDSLVARLGVKPEKHFHNVAKVGNTVSASIPIALKDASDEGRISSGDLVLISGFGVGLAWATALLRW
jgi:3-oxoacyl-[acyl-carrier-protein] synthase-3